MCACASARRVGGGGTRAGLRSGAVRTLEAKVAMLHGRPVNYVEVGAGPVLLLVHGMGGGYDI